VIDEGVIKFELDWTEAPPPDPRGARLLDRWRRPLYRAGLIGEYAEERVGYGNLSLRRADDGRFLITGTQTGHLPKLGPEHFALVTGYDIEANSVACRGPIRASSKSMTHAAIYELSPDIGAVVHVHDAALWRQWGGVLPTTRADVPYGTPAMAAEFGRLYRETAFARDGLAVMGGHEDGIVGTGHGIAEAARRILELHGRSRDD